MIHWVPRIYGTTTQFKWADIAAGTYDNTYVIPTAQNMRDFGKKFLMVFHNEMNASSTAQGGTYGTDAEYASAARHVHDVFVAQGATNVVWVFKPSGYTTTIGRMNTLYPGDAYIDWIGYDPYGNASSTDTADYVITTKYPMLDWMLNTKPGRHDMPMIWGEWGKVDVSTNTNKATYISRVQTLLKSTYPQIKGIAWFGSTAGTGECINTSASALTAYKALAADAFYNPDMSDVPAPVGTGLFRAGTSKGFNNSAAQSITVPSAIQAGDGMLLWHTSTRTGLKNAGEGTNAATVTVANSNTVGSNPWDSVSVSQPPTYSTAQSHLGTSAIHYAVTAGTSSSTSWTSSFGTQVANQPYYGRFYFYRTALPTQITRIFQQNPTTGNTFGVGIDTTGNIIVRDVSGGATRLTLGGGVPAANVWHRVEFKTLWDGTNNVVDVRLYSGANLDGLTLTDSGTSTSFAQTAGAGVNYIFGITATSAQTFDLFIVHAAVDRNTWLGPAQVSPVLTAPAGWIALTPRLLSSGAGELASRLYKKAAASGDPGSVVNLNTDVNGHGSIDLVAYSGIDPAIVDIFDSSTKTSNSATVTSPNVTTTAANDVIVSAFFDRTNPGTAATASWTPPAGDTIRASSFGTGTDGRVSGAVTDDGTQHAIGTYGTQVATADQQSYLGIGWTVALKSSGTSAGGQHLGQLHQPS
jgi:hypothetical protein